MIKCQYFDHNDWLQFRLSRITATEAASIVGANPYRSAGEVLNDKLNPVFNENNFIIVGRLMETTVINVANYVMKRNFRPFTTDNDEKIIYFNDILGATPDAFEGDSLLECKTTKPVNYFKYQNCPPKYYIIQALTQLICTELPRCYLAIMSTNLSQETEQLQLPISVFEINRSPVIEEILSEETKRFWECYRQGKTFRVKSEVKSTVNFLIPTIYKKVI